MDNFPIKKLSYEYWPKQLTEISNKPKRLYYRGSIPNPEHKFLCIIGPRKHTEYGVDVCKNLISGLQGFPITIVSGLAYGIDSIAHNFAIDYKINTIAFPGSGLDKNVIYPRAHFNLAIKILESGGTLISEFSNKTVAAPWTFPSRNRLMAGICDAVLVIESGEKSGTMITSRLALDYNRDVLAVPGSIFNFNSTGTNNLIKEGAAVITKSEDILYILGFDNEKINSLKIKHNDKIINNLNNLEKKIYRYLKNPNTIENIINHLSIEVEKVIAYINELELKGLIQQKNNIVKRI